MNFRTNIHLQEQSSLPDGWLRFITDRHLQEQSSLPDGWLRVRWGWRPSGAAPASRPSARWSDQFRDKLSEISYCICLLHFYCIYCIDNSCYCTDCTFYCIDCNYLLLYLLQLLSEISYCTAFIADIIVSTSVVIACIASIGSITVVIWNKLLHLFIAFYCSYCIYCI